MSVVAFNPCITCGACCAYYRISFYWSEACNEAGGTVPAELTEKVNSHFVAMKKIGDSPSRCVALQGTIGANVSCNIYPDRSSTCREFAIAWEHGEANDKCNKARMAHGLPPIEPPKPFIPVWPETPQVA